MGVKSTSRYLSSLLSPLHPSSKTAPPASLESQRQLNEVSTMSSRLLLISLILFATLSAADESTDIPNQEPHPDPNEEDYVGMAYIGRMDDEGRRVGFDFDNGK